MLFPGGKNRKADKKQNKIKKKDNSLLAHKTPVLLPPINKMIRRGKASSGTSPGGSLTVESAFVLPVFFLILCTIISFMDIYRIQSVKLTQLCQQAKEAAMYAYSLDMQEDIVLPAVYTYHPIIAVVPLPDVVMTNQVRVHPWTGYQPGEDEGEAEEMVYVTENMGVYHRSADCSYLRLSVHQVAGSQVEGLRNSYGERYHPCEKCVGDIDMAGIVYITDTGSRYHNQSTCSGLKRTIRLVKLSQVSHLRPCSRCGGAH